MKPSAGLSNGRRPMGSGRNTGLRVRSRTTREKKVARPPDGPGLTAPRLGLRVPGRGVVEPSRPAHAPDLDRRQAAALDPKRARPSRPRAQGCRVLWAVTRGHTG